MSEFEDMLGKILSDSAGMEKIAGMAARLMGGGDAGAERGTGEGAEAAGMLQGLLSAASDGGDKAALVAALGPYLKPERRRKLEKALRIGRIAGMAGTALKGMGDADVQGI